ncbi:SAM-dependent methyltransferase [Halomonas sp. M4R5S39]|uniref:SAM-dependent methyltransferase n=1 Tax=Halomonas kalidii TaxID=3043293 RepID=UPI0024A84E03|nr:SAM-dependent methyltransferase [Halomonas kalidii]MDI5986619.1 SAM-dependent methyltransferase [Halomonas kalidii]
MNSRVARRETNPYPALGLRLDPRFVGALVEYVRTRGGIPFAEFMDRSLYGLDGEGGYYNSGVVSIGNTSGDDFLTAPERSRYFGRTIAKALVDMHAAMGYPRRFDVVEMGAGNGTLAHDIIETLQADHVELHGALRYTIVECSRALIMRQREALAGRKRVRWVHANADSLPLWKVRGVLLSNELPDAFPVHRAVVRDGEIREIYVTVDSHGDFGEEERSPSPALAAVLLDLNKLFPIAAQPDGERLTVNARAMHWMRELGVALDEGYVLTFDYGRPGVIRQAPYTVFDWEQYPLNIGYRYPGAVDMTSHVDPVVLSKVGERVGLKPVSTTSAPKGLYTQPAFLEANGLREALAMEADTRERSRALGLLGEDYFNFFALVQEKSRETPGDDGVKQRSSNLISRVTMVPPEGCAHLYHLGDIKALNRASNQGALPPGHYVHFIRMRGLVTAMSSLHRCRVLSSGHVGDDGHVRWPSNLKVRACHDVYIVVTALSVPEMKDRLLRGVAIPFAERHGADAWFSSDA